MFKQIKYRPNTSHACYSEHYCPQGSPTASMIEAKFKPYFRLHFPHIEIYNNNDAKVIIYATHTMYEDELQEAMNFLNQALNLN